MEHSFFDSNFSGAACYIDFYAGAAIASLGHAHPQLVAALEAQLHTMMVGNFMTEQRMQLLDLIACLTPGELTQTYLYSTTAEAVEAAIGLAQAYTKKYELVGFWGSCHDTTDGAVGLPGQTPEPGWGCVSGGTHLVPYADCYRCPFQLRYPACGMFCLDFMRQHIKKSTTGSIAAIIVEPIQGSTGNIVPPPEFLPGVKAIAQEVGALLITDESVTGFGRTGAMFASVHTGVIPDIVTIGQGMGGGFPVSGVVATPEITAAARTSAPTVCASRSGDNSLAVVAALATIQTIVRDKLVTHTAQVGALMLDGLRALQEKYAFIGDVHGQGLLIGVDLVHNRQTKEVLSSRVTERIFQAALQRGLLMMGYVPRLRLNPPLVITAEQIQAGIDILDEVFQDLADEVAD